MQTTVCSPWAVLGLDEGASLAEVRRAFRQRAKTTHPDRGGSRDEFEAARAAFERLYELARRDDNDADTGAPEPCRQPRRPVAPGSRPHLRPAPRGVVQAYAWTADAARRAEWAERGGRATGSRSAAPARTPATASAFAAVLDAVLARPAAA